MDTGTLCGQLCTITSSANGFHSTHEMNAKWGGPPATPGVAMETNPSHNFWGDEEAGLIHSLHSNEEAGRVHSLHSEEAPPLLSWGNFLLNQD